MKKISKILSTAYCLLLAGAANASLIVNGDFETGNFTGWNTSQAGGSNIFVAADPGDPTLGASLTGDFYAFAGNQTAPSQNIFWQSFALPVGLTALNFTFDYAYDSFTAFRTPNPDSLDHTSGVANQQFRVEFLTGTALFDSVNPADIIFSALQTAPGSPDPQPWTTFSQDVLAALSPFQGQTLQVRFAQVDNRSPFDVGFDNVSLVAKTTAVPEPTSLVLLGLGLAGISFSRRKKLA